MGMVAIVLLKILFVMVMLSLAQHRTSLARAAKREDPEEKWRPAWDVGWIN